MKLIITIPKDKYRYIQKLEQDNTDYATTRMLYHAVTKGKPYLEQGDVLRELRQEIVGFRDDAEIRYGHQLGFDKIYAYERCIDLIDTKIKELSE